MFLDFYRGKKIFVTGHTGFKGAWLTEWLLHLGANVTGFSIDVPTEPSIFEALGLSKRAKDMRGDILHGPSIEAAIKEANPEIVFHLAAQPLVRLSYDQPKLTFETNAIGTLNVLEAIRKTSSVKAAVMITTDKVYENIEREYSYREEDKLGGYDPYSASKACAEIIISSYVRSFFKDGRSIAIASARAGNVIGGGDWSLDRIIPDTARAWSAGKSVNVRNPASTRPWQHVLEPLGGYLLLVEKLFNEPKKFHGEAFNFGPTLEANRTVLDLMKECEKNWPDMKHILEPDKSGKHEANLLSLSIEKAKEQLGWHPKLSFSETIQWTIDWYKNYYKNSDLAQKLTNEQIASFQAKLSGRK